MNKSDLVSTVSELTELNQRTARVAVQTVLDALAHAMSSGERISLTGFGSFNIVPRAAKVSRNLRTGEKMITPPRNAIVFKPGKDLADRVNNQ